VGDIELVVTDLDRTLWTRPGQLHGTTVAAWHELERRGIAVMAATGRRLASTRGPLGALGLTPPAVVMNGALGLELATGTRFHTHHYEPAAARQVLAAFRACDLEPCVYVDHREVDVYVGERPSTHPEHLRSFGDTARRADLEAIVETVPVFMFGLLGLDRTAYAEGCPSGWACSRTAPASTSTRSGCSRSATARTTSNC
jgi:hydroxymethylpyrimidine pyrophosphatase-like HAD family hydrolase